MSTRATSPVKYVAFISYRHCEPDRDWAKWLHRSLETYRTPGQLVKQGYAARLGRVFRDEEELAASSNLSTAITEALENSKSLVVICSPNTPSSEWVNQEIVRFQQLGRQDQVLSVLIAGEPNQSFPRALCELRHSLAASSSLSRAEVHRIEPLAADVRPLPGESLRQRRHLAKLRIIAGILGCEFDELRQRERERNFRRRVIFSSVLTVILLVLAALGATAAVQWRRAKKEIIAANTARQRAQGAALARRLGRADAIGQTDPGAALATLEDIDAFPPPSRETPWKILRQRFNHLLWQQQFSQGVLDLAYRTQGTKDERLVILSSQGDVFVQSPGKAVTAPTWRLARDLPENARLRVDGRYVAAPGAETLDIWPLVEANPSPTPLRLPVAATHFCFSLDGQSVKAIGTDLVVRSWNLADGRELESQRFELLDRTRLRARKEEDDFILQVTHLAALDTTRAVVGVSTLFGGGEFHQSSLWLVDLAQKTARQVDNFSASRMVDASPLGNTSQLAMLVQFDDRATMNPPHIGLLDGNGVMHPGYRDSESPVASLATSRDGEVVAVGTSAGFVRILDSRLRETLKTLRGTKSDAVNGVQRLAISQQGRQVAVTDDQGNVAIWSGTAERLPVAGVGAGAHVWALGVDGGGQRGFAASVGPGSEDDHDWSWSPMVDKLSNGWDDEKANWKVGRTAFGDAHVLPLSFLPSKINESPATWSVCGIADDLSQVVLRGQRQGDESPASIVRAYLASAQWTVLSEEPSLAAIISCADFSGNTITLGCTDGRIIHWPSSRLPAERETIQAPGPVIALRRGRQGDFIVALTQTSDDEANGYDATAPGVLWLRKTSSSWRPLSRQTTYTPVANRSWRLEGLSSDTGTFQLIEDARGTRILAGEVDGQLLIHDVENESSSRTSVGLHGAVSRIVVSPDHSAVFVTGAMESETSATFLCDPWTQVVLYELRIANQHVQRVAISPRGQHLIAATVDGRIWWIDNLAEPPKR